MNFKRPKPTWRPINPLWMWWNDCIIENMIINLCQSRAIVRYETSVPAGISFTSERLAFPAPQIIADCYFSNQFICVCGGFQLSKYSIQHFNNMKGQGWKVSKDWFGKVSDVFIISYKLGLLNAFILSYLMIQLMCWLINDINFCLRNYPWNIEVIVVLDEKISEQTLQ